MLMLDMRVELLNGVKNQRGMFAQMLSKTEF